MALGNGKGVLLLQIFSASNFYEGVGPGGVIAQWSVQVRTEAHRESTAWVPHYIPHNSILALHAEIHTSHFVHLPPRLPFLLTFSP